MGAFRQPVLVAILFFASFAYGMDCHQRIALVADPWSSARFLVEALERRGIVVHGLQSQPTIPEWGKSSFYLAPGRKLIVFNGDRALLEQQVRELNPDEILYGADGDGILLVDWLTETIGRRGNGTAKSMGRRTKTGTQKLLAEGKKNHLRGILTGDLEEARHFAAQEGYPLIIKPDGDGGGNLVFRLANDHDLTKKLELLLASRNETTLLPITHAAIQKFADGVEFAVQGTVRHGETKFSSVIEYEKATIDENTETYQAEWMLDPNSANARLLMDFVEAANAVVGLQFGPFHWELKISKQEDGVIAIELNPRLIGGSMVQWLTDCVGYSDVELTVEAYFFPEEFKQRPKVYSVQNPGFVYEAITPTAGLELDEKALQTIADLPGFKRWRLLRPEGGPLPKTKNMDSIGATFDFAHPSKAKLNESYKVLQTMQKERTFFKK